ncbi:hypothetical protein [Nocardia sp. CA-290969]|uniref:hypothetical protein n=1 Tax=Nocardia sp. CA-290969 TaxID=3239986 RepID=UPI003D8D0CF1
MLPKNRMVAVFFGYSTLIAVGIASVANLINGTWSWKWVAAAVAFSCFLTWSIYQRGRQHLYQMNAWILAAADRYAEGRYLEASELFKRAGARSHVLLGPQHPFTESLRERFDDAYRKHLEEQSRETLTAILDAIKEQPGTTTDRRTDPTADE